MESNGETKTQGLGPGKTLGYVVGQFGGNIFNLVFTGWIVFFFTTKHSGHDILVSIGWIGAAQMAGRAVDAFTDLGVGYWSDVTRTRWGRRRPFIIIGTPLLTMMFFLLFNPPFPAGSPQLIAYVFVVMGLFWFFFTFTMAPYLALMPEICETSQQRVSMSTYMTIFMMLAQVYQGIAVPIMIKHWDFKTMAVVSGILGFIFMLTPGLVIKEKKLTGDTHPNFMEAVRWTFANPAFIVYTTSSICIYLGFAAVTASIPFIVTVLFDKPIDFVPVVYGIMMVGFAISFFIVNMLTKKMEKARLYRYSIIAIALTMPLLFLVGRVTFPIETWKVGIIIMLVMALPIAANMVLPMAILADVIDFDEKRTGQQRAAMYFGCQGFLQKLATGLSAGIQALLFGVFGYSAENHLGLNLLGPVAGVFSFIGYLIFLKYPLDEKTKELKVKKA